MTEASKEIEILDQLAGALVTAAYRNVEIVAWRTTGTVEAVERAFSGIERLAKRCPQGVSSLHIVSRNASLPPKAARDQMVVLGRRFASQTIAVGIVTDHSGFVASALRSMATNISLLIHAKYPMRVHGSIAEAAQWLAAMHAKQGVSLDAAGLQAAALAVWHHPEGLVKATG